MTSIAKAILVTTRKRSKQVKKVIGGIEHDLGSCMLSAPGLQEIKSHLFHDTIQKVTLKLTLKYKCLESHTRPHINKR